MRLTCTDCGKAVKTQPESAIPPVGDSGSWISCTCVCGNVEYICRRDWDKYVDVQRRKDEKVKK